MHIHANLFDPNLQLSAQYAAERAAAKKEAAEVRENLFKLAASVDADSAVAQDAVTASRERQQRQGQGRQSYSQSARSLREQEEGPGQNAGESSSGGRFSAWA